VTGLSVLFTPATGGQYYAGPTDANGDVTGSKTPIVVNELE